MLDRIASKVPLVRSIARLGFDHGGDRYGYVDDADFGVINREQRVDRWVRTTCGYCSVGCGMVIGVRDDRIVATKGDPDHPVNRGRLCPKGLAEHLPVHADGRLTAPSVDGSAADWDSAIHAMLDRFRTALDRHGPDAVAIIGTGQLLTEEFYALGKLARLGLGVRHSDGNTTLCMASAVSGYKATFGSDGPPSSYTDLELADCLLLIGANVADNHPLLTPRVLNNEHGVVVAVDPRVTKTTMLADLHVPLLPRSDVSFLNGLIRQVIVDELVDAAFVDESTAGFDAVREHVMAFTPDLVADQCGISADDVIRVARAFATAERGMVAWTMGVNHSEQGTDTVATINTLCAITGNIGRPGTGPMSITGQCNAMGTRETGFTASMPGYRRYDDAAHRAELAELWNVEVGRLPAERGRAYPDIVDGVLDGTIRALWVIGTNPLVSFPNRERTEQALRDLDVLVVQDSFSTPTTAIADIVLPAATWGEKDGTYTNSERRVSRARAAVPPPGVAEPDFDVFLRVADAAGVRDEVFPGWKVPEDAYEEWRRVSAGRPCDHSAISYELIDELGGVQWPCTEAAPTGSERLYTDGRFHHDDGRAHLSTVDPEPFGDQPDDEFPLVLNTGRTVEHWHTRTKTGRAAVLEALVPEAWVSVNPADASTLGVGSGDRVRLVSRRGSVDDVVVRVTETVRAGEVFVPMHFDEACVNRLTVDAFDPVSREPNYKQCAIRIEPS
ncbi:MAG: nitrate reductase [Actinomycetota bacterium]